MSMNYLKKNKEVTSTPRGATMQVLAGAVVGMVVSLIGVIVMAILLRINPMMERNIFVISQSVKYFSAICAAIAASAGRGSKGYLRGMAGALVYLVIGFIIFGIFGGGLHINMQMLIDVIICAVIGILCGAVMVNLTRKKR